MLSKQNTFGNYISKKDVSPNKKISSISYSPDGTEIAICQDNGLVIRLNTKTNEIFKKRISGHKSGITCFQYLPCSKQMVTGGRDGDISLWDLSKENPTRKILKGHKPGISCLSVSEDGTELVSGDKSGNIVFWDLTKIAIEKSIPKAHDISVKVLSYHKDKRFCTSIGSDSAIIRWDLRTKEIQEKQIYGDTSYITSFNSSKDTDISLFYTFQGNLYKINNLAKLNVEKVSINNPQPDFNLVTNIEYSPDNKEIFLSRYAAPTLTLNANTFDVLPDNQDAFFTSKGFLLSYSPDGKEFAVCSKSGFLTKWKGTYHENPLGIIPHSTTQTDKDKSYLENKDSRKSKSLGFEI